jgi:hypothetical protein
MISRSKSKISSNSINRKVPVALFWMGNKEYGLLLATRSSVHKKVMLRMLMNYYDLILASGIWVPFICKWHILVRSSFNRILAGPMDAK